MSTHTAGPVRHELPGRAQPAAPHIAAWAVPVVLGVAYGGYTTFEDAENGRSAGAAGILGAVVTVIVVAVCYFIGRVQAGVQAETRAFMYGIFFGCAMGFLVSVSGDSILKSAGIGLALGLSMGLVTFYIAYGKGRGVS